MKTILFATSNPIKVGEAQFACQKYNIDVKQIKLNLEEIQSNDPKLVSKRKVESAYLLVKKPVVVTDTSWNIPALKGFPGAYMKNVVGWLSQNDFLNLMRDKSDKRVSFIESIFYKDSHQIKSFSKEFWGTFVEKPRGKGNSLENVVEFEGYTLGERREQGGFSHKPEDYVWIDFAKWYSSK
ncbi:MAG: non-canonical purine NTP pyrophosphatase [Patescibacteria group bacterium]|nr:hypothetical protein [Patescibacteria group bacterium]